MATPGYDGQVIGRDCDCEDFPCCGHGITQADVQSVEEYEWEMFERGYDEGPDWDTRDQEGYDDEPICLDCGLQGSLCECEPEGRFE